MQRNDVAGREGERHGNVRESLGSIDGDEQVRWQRPPIVGADHGGPSPGPATDGHPRRLVPDHSPFPDPTFVDTQGLVDARVIRSMNPGVVAVTDIEVGTEPRELGAMECRRSPPTSASTPGAD